MEGGNTLLMVNANDLKEFALSLIEETRNQKQEREREKFLSENEVCERINVTHATLWRWNKSGFLHTYKIGRKCFWKESDIEKLIEGSNQ